MWNFLKFETTTIHPQISMQLLLAASDHQVWYIVSFVCFIIKLMCFDPHRALTLCPSWWDVCSWRHRQCELVVSHHHNHHHRQLIEADDDEEQFRTCGILISSAVHDWRRVKVLLCSSLDPIDLPYQVFPRQSHLTDTRSITVEPSSQVKRWLYYDKHCPNKLRNGFNQFGRTPGDCWGKRKERFLLTLKNMCIEQKIQTDCTVISSH